MTVGVGNTSILDAESRLRCRFLLLRLAQQIKMSSAMTTPAAAMPPMAELLRLLSELLDLLGFVVVAASVTQGDVVQVVVLEVGVEGL